MARISALSFALLAALSATAWSAPYPTRPIEIVVPYGAGGSTDLVARTLAQQLQTRLGQSVVVLNKPGGAGTIAVLSVTRAEPDGYTLLLGFTTELGVMPHMSKAAKYSMADFTPIAVTGDVPLVMIGASACRAPACATCWPRSAPRPANSPMAAAWAAVAHLRRLDEPRRRAQDGSRPLQGRRAGGDRRDRRPHRHLLRRSRRRQGRDRRRRREGLRADRQARSTALPQVPTFAEAGLPISTSAAGRAARAQGTPAEVVARLKTEVAASLAAPQVRDLLKTQGVEPPRSNDPAAFLADEEKKFERLVRETGVTMEQ